MRRSARLLPFIAILALLVIAVLVFLKAGPLPDYVRGVIASEFSKQLGRDVTIGRASLALSGEVALHDLLIRNQDGTPLLKVSRVDALVGSEGSLIPLLSGATNVRSVRLVRPELNLTRLPTGELNVNDILERSREAPSKFQGSVEIEDGRITFVDEANDGLATSISGIDVSVEYPEPGRAVFTVTAPENEGAFGMLKVQGESRLEAGATRVEYSAADVSLPYVLARFPSAAVGKVPAGRADVRGKVAFRAGEEGQPSYDVQIVLTDTEVAFPWLRRPLLGVRGRLGIADGVVELHDIAGTLADAPVTINGSIRGPSDPTLALTVTASEIRYPQIRALFPDLALPATLLLPSPLRVTASVEGPASDVSVAGEATMELIEFRAVPWRKIATSFKYRGGQLNLHGRGQGSPRRFEADVDLDLTRPRPKAAGTVSLVNVPLAVLATMAGVQGDFEGIVEATVQGKVDGASDLSGHVRITEASLQGIMLGDVEGEFNYSDGTMRLPLLRVDGPAARGTLKAEFSASGDYTIDEARFAFVDLSEVGPAVRLEGLRGQCCAHVTATGQLTKGSIEGHFSLGPGEVQGRPFDELTANFAVSPASAAVRDIELRMGAGRYQGEIEVGDWRGAPEHARVSGRLDVVGVGVADWLPRPLKAAAPEGVVSGAVVIDGTLADPVVELDLQVESLAVAGHPFEAGRLRAEYVEGGLTIGEARVGLAGGLLSATGGYSPDEGFSVQIVGEDIELDRLTQYLRSQLGLDLEGQLGAEVSLLGPKDRPELVFLLDARPSDPRPLQLNGVEFDGLRASGRLRDSVLELDSFTLQSGESLASLSGEIDAADRSITAELTLDRVNVRSVMRIARSARWRLYRAGIHSPFLDGYDKAVAPLTGPLEGTLTALVHASGSVTAPELDVESFSLDEIAFSSHGMDHNIDHVGGSLTASLRAEPPDGMALEQATLNLEASHGIAQVSLIGDISSDKETDLELQVNNLDLRLLEPWVGGRLALSGMGTINFDITGPIQQPVLQGDVFVENLTAGPLSLEALAAWPVTVDEGMLKLEEIQLRNGPMTGSGSLQLPIKRPVPEGELHIQNASYAPLPGMVPAEFDAHMYLRDNRIILQDGEHEDGSGAGPGITGKMGSGSFKIGGQAELRAADLEESQEAPIDITAKLEGLEVTVPGMVDMRVDGDLRLTNDPETGEPLLMTEAGRPLVVSEATLGVPKELPSAAGAGLEIGPKVRVRVLVGEKVWFRYGSPRRPTEIEVAPGGESDEGEPTGYLDLGGRATAEGLTLVGEFESKQGWLAFPNGTLTLQRARASVSRRAGEVPVVIIDAEASGRVGDYYVSMRPVGQVFPYEPEPGPGEAPSLQVNASSIPYLEEGFVLALLAGPVVAPTRGARSSVAQLLSDPTRGQGVEGEIRGVMVPAFSDASGRAEVGVDVETSGQMRLRLGQRLSDRFAISYVSSLGEARRSYTLRFTYQVTHLWSVGRAVDERDQGRWEVQAFIPF